MVEPSEAIIECPLCGCPHREAANTCDACGQDLRSPPNIGAMKDEYARRRRDLALALAAIGAMVALNLAFFGGAGFILLVAPFVWLIRSWIRGRALRARLARHVDVPAS
jgi:hypothetical protein